MKQKPILFSAPMVRALEERRKTMTRRVVSPNNIRFFDTECPAFRPSKELLAKALTGVEDLRSMDQGRFRWKAESFDYQAPATHTNWLAESSFVPGDRLWVKERMDYCLLESQEGSNPADVLNIYGHVYHADRMEIKPIPDDLPDNFKDLPDKTIPAIFMPRWASRITLEVTNVRMERVQDITEADAIAEGFPWIASHLAPPSPTEWFKELWDEINAKRGFSWASNPWVWVDEFKLSSN